MRFNSKMCSSISPTQRAPYTVLVDDGVFGTKVPEMALVGDYRDYTISSLQAAGIPLTAAAPLEMSLDEVSSQVSQIVSKVKSNKINK